MLIGHLPVGYFLTSYLIKKNHLPLNKVWLGLGLVASVLPDFDIIYPILFNDSLGSHRYFFTYIPLFWLALWLGAWAGYKIFKRVWLRWAILIIFVNVFAHLLLDTVFVGVRWFWPIYQGLVGIYNVGFTGGFLVDNYFHHWFWYLEIALWLAAIVAVEISYKKGELK